MATNNKDFIVKNGIQAGGNAQITGSLQAANLTYPVSDGNPGDALVTNGSGTLSFSPVDTTRLVVENNSGALIAKGTPVYQTGTGLNGEIQIAPSDASSASTMPAIGLAATDIADNDTGYVVASGRLTGISTTSFSLGDHLYVASGTGLTNTRPTTEALTVQYVGMVAEVAASGVIIVNDENHALDLPNLDDGKVFIGDNTDTATTATLDTDLVPEGSNQYFTTTRAIDAIEGASNLTFNNNTLYLDDANQRVGIGDTSPSYMLDVGGTTGGGEIAVNGIKVIDTNGEIVTSQLKDSGVTANTYGSSSAIPVITVDAKGRITSATTAAISTDLDIAGDSGTGSVSLASETLTFTGDTGITTTVSTNSVVIDLDDTAVTAGSYGSSTAIPVITIDQQGRITGASTASVSGVDGLTYNTSTGVLTVETATGTDYTTTITLGPFDTGDLTEGSNLYYTDQRVRDLLAGESALSIGAATSTTTVEDDLVVEGDLTVNGTTFTVNTDQLDVTDNIIHMASGNTAHTTDVGFLGHYEVSGTEYEEGLVKDQSASAWKLMTGILHSNVDATVDFSGASYDDLYINNIRTGYGSASECAVQLNDVNSGIFSTGSGNYINFSHNGTHAWTMGNNFLQYQPLGGGPTLRGTTSSSTVPTLVPYRDDTNTGLGANGSDEVYLIAGGNPILTANSTGVDISGNIAVSGTVDGRDIASDGSKLDGIESGATGDQTASEILTLIKTVDGSGSGLDADTVDGLQASQFLRSDADDTFSGKLTYNTGSNASSRAIELYVYSTDESYKSIGARYSSSNPYNQSEIRFLVESNAAGKGALAFATGQNSTTERMRITSGGNVGIGTASPTQKLDVRGNVSIGNDSYQMAIGTENAKATSSVAHTATYAEGIFWHNQNNEYGIYRTSGAWTASTYQQLKLDWTTGIILAPGSSYDKSFVDVQGKMGIGAPGVKPSFDFVVSGDAAFGSTSTTSSVYYGGSPAAGLFVNTNGTDNNDAWFGHQSKINANLYLSKQSGYTNSNFIRFYEAGSSNYRGGVDIVAGVGVSYNTTSDRRLKENIVPITDGKEKLLAMNPCTFTFKADDDKKLTHGFIAQEMQEVVPEAVSGDPDAEEMMSMDYGRITPVIVAALQDALKEIEELKTRINELEAK